MSAIDSRSPIRASLPSTLSGKPPSSAMPAVNETWVRSVGLSKMTATARGPVERRADEPVVPERERELEDLALLARA